MKRRLRAPSPAFVISLIALFVALGGTTYAATSLPKNSVGTKQLKTNAVTAVKIKNGAVTAAKINTSGLTVPDALHATSAGSAAPSGTAGGALSGTYPNPGLAASAVTSSKIAAGAVQDAKIAAGTITADKLASGTLTLAHIAAWSTSGGTGETRSRRTAASCTTSVPSSGVQESDIVIGSVIGLPTPGGLITYGYICDNSGDLSGGWCNLTGSPITPTGGIGETFYGLR